MFVKYSLELEKAILGIKLIRFSTCMRARRRIQVFWCSQENSEADFVGGDTMHLTRTFAIMVLISVVGFAISGCKKQTEPAEKEPVAKQTEEEVIVQKICPVMEGPIDKNIFVEYKGKKVYFCCEACKEKFNEEPEKYLDKLPQFEDIQEEMEELESEAKDVVEEMKETVDETMEETMEENMDTEQ